MAVLLEAKGITKRFNNFCANENVDFYCNKGSVISLLGENGAGKSTLMKIIYGMLIPDEGQIFYNENPIQLRSPKDAIALGIQMVHQHFMLVSDLTIAENIVMGNEPQKYGLFKKKKAEEIVMNLAETYGLHVNPKQKISDLSVGAKQRTEILKALYHGAELLILDEPTAVLTPQETTELFKVIERLKNDGKSIIIITHKLHETMDVADEIFVMRQGKMVGQVKKVDTNPKELTKMMVNHELKQFNKTKANTGEVFLKIKDLCFYDSEHVPVLQKTNIQISGGEIYGVAGIEGNGQQELIEIVSGITKGWSGEVEIFNQSIEHKNSRQIIDMGVGCIHADRHDRGLLLELDAKQNILLGYQHTDKMRGGSKFLNNKALSLIADEIFRDYKTYPHNINLPAANFSGGNQQKIIVGREFYRNPKLAIIAYPTRGVDIGVSEIIHNRILELRDNGSAILLITGDFDELFKLSDRIGVLFEGEIVTEGIAEDYTPAELGFFMGGGNKK